MHRCTDRQGEPSPQRDTNQDTGGIDPVFDAYVESWDSGKEFRRHPCAEEAHDDMAGTRAVKGERG
jgi:hypothetical protein